MANKKLKSFANVKTIDTFARTKKRRLTPTFFCIGEVGEWLKPASYK